MRDRFRKAYRGQSGKVLKALLRNLELEQKESLDM